MLTTEAPPVKAFWSVTVYDSATGRFHPNDDDRYHINNTTAVKNEDGTYTFRFKVKCEEGDVNCLEVPAGPFDLAIRYYLPGPEIISGEWTMPRPVLQKSTAAADEPLTPAEAREIAKEAFYWGMHPVALYHLRYNFVQNEKSPKLVGVNRLGWDRSPMKALPRIATTPNATTLYGVGFLDLSKEPAVVTVAEVKDRYWSVQFHDNYARWWHMIGSQFDAPGPVRRLLIGPNWSGDLPDGFVGADIVRSPSDCAGVLARVALTDDTPEDLAIVNGIQDRFTVMSLSAWIAAGGKDVKTEDVPMVKGAYPTYPGMETVAEPGKLGGVDFLRWVSLVLNDSSFTKQTDGHQEITALMPCLSWARHGRRPCHLREQGGCRADSPPAGNGMGLGGLAGRRSLLPERRAQSPGRGLSTHLPRCPGRCVLVGQLVQQGGLLRSQRSGCLQRQQPDRNSQRGRLLYHPLRR